MTAVRSAHRVHVLICDDCLISRAGLQAVVQSAPDLIVVGHADTSVRAVELSRRLAPHVALVTLDQDGAARGTIRALRHGGVEVVVLSRPGTELGVGEAYRLGARSCLSDAVLPARLIEVIRTVAGDESRLTTPTAVDARDPDPSVRPTHTW